MSTTTTRVGPLIAAGSRFPVGEPPLPGGGLSPVGARSFLLRFAEPVAAAVYGTRGATPQQTTGYDGRPDRESEDFNAPDFAP